MSAARRRGLALLALAVAVILLGASVATWANVAVDDAVSDAVAVERTRAIAGSQRAGGLVATALLAMAATGVCVRWRQAGWVLAALGGGSLVLLVNGWPDEGAVTSAPGIAAAACVGLVVLGALIVRAGPDLDEAGAEPARAGHASRYTVEAAAGQPDPGRTIEELDEWDAAVAEEPE